MFGMFFILIITSSFNLKYYLYKYVKSLIALIYIQMLYK